jgi:acetyl esterase
MHFFWNTYLNRKFKVLTEAQSAAIKAIPAASEKLASLPPTFLSTAENDPLRDEGIAFNGALQAAGVATEHHHFQESEHGFATAPDTDSNALRQINAINDWIEGLLHKPSN